MTSPGPTYDKNASLSARLRDRDSSALSELYDCYGTAVFTLIMRITRNAATAEDLTQEVFLRVWNRIFSFDSERGSLSAWLLTIARYTAIDFLRSRGGQQLRMNISLDSLERPLRAANMEMYLVSSTDARQVRAAMNRLEPKYRLLLELAYFEGFSQSEMAGKLSMPMGTLKTRVRSALNQLRDNLTEVHRPHEVATAFSR